ncbi:hypothetical protein AtubIFM57258_000183 [Aspergillus tubingensis]|uniref:Uncharacterized protein n=1 Tax=Aspergillus costaricaensis CBS 115574 TaxID=1448317 RepID=A0ACD1IVV3_9EURO|nr:hypothetical protein BO79DRAFT_234253 [Aspergillus costaricaensis CBS 115574]RAK94580.1 hypothetical protein BO79DRAFT_234253 [Aspergillus costaricaensis CBS 115574]GLB01773.1 hypothetical protein AtubIFM57258_000183 [Aspergillus tubingensis]
MHLSLFSLFSLLSASTLATAASAARHLTITIPPSAILPNPNVLPANTHATLTTFTKNTNDNHHFTAPLSRSATFDFHHLPASSKPESYLLDIRSPEYVFAPLRVDVAADGSVLGIWETFRGNPWDNRGAEKFVFDASAPRGGNSGAEEAVMVEAKVLARRGFYEERSKFSPLALFKNPMILMALVALGFTFGMPKLMENMDPEMRAEFEKQSRSSPIGGATRSAMAGGGAPGNFDLAGWMAGATPRPGASGAEAAAAIEGAAATTGREGGGASRRRG